MPCRAVLKILFEQRTHGPARRKSADQLEKTTLDWDRDHMSADEETTMFKNKDNGVDLHATVPHDGVLDQLCRWVHEEFFNTRIVGMPCT